MGVIKLKENFSGKQICEGYPQRVMNKNGVWQYTEKYYVKKDELSENLPEDGTTYPEDSTAYLQSVTVETAGAGFGANVYTVTVVWGDPDGDDWNGIDNSKEVSYRSTTTRQERAIEQHPDWETLTEDEQKAEKAKNPAFAFIAVNFIRTETKKKKHAKITESMLIEGIDQTGAPKGLSGATAAKWMKTGREISFGSGSFTVTDTWTYDKNGWTKVKRGFEGELE